MIYRYYVREKMKEFITMDIYFKRLRKCSEKFILKDNFVKYFISPSKEYVCPKNFKELINQKLYYDQDNWIKPIYLMAFNSNVEFFDFLLKNLTFKEMRDCSSDGKSLFHATVCSENDSDIVISKLRLLKTYKLKENCKDRNGYTCIYFATCEKVIKYLISLNCSTLYSKTVLSDYIIKCRNDMCISHYLKAIPSMAMYLLDASIKDYKIDKIKIILHNPTCLTYDQTMKAYLTVIHLSLGKFGYFQWILNAMNYCNDKKNLDFSVFGLFKFTYGNFCRYFGPIGPEMNKFYHYYLRRYHGQKINEFCLIKYTESLIKYPEVLLLKTDTVILYSNYLKYFLTQCKNDEFYEKYAINVITLYNYVKNDLLFEIISILVYNLAEIDILRMKKLLILGANFKNSHKQNLLQYALMKNFHEEKLVSIIKTGIDSNVYNINSTKDETENKLLNYYTIGTML